MADRPIKHVTNNTACTIVAPPCDEFVNGLNLVPGHNNWPSKYEASMRATSRGAEKLAAFFKRHTKPVAIYSASGSSFGPQLTCLYEELDLPEGPEPPLSLPANEKAAIAIVNAVEPKGARNLAALDRWLATAKGGVRSAILAKKHEVA